MRKLFSFLLVFATVMVALLPADLTAGQKRKVVVRPAKVVVRPSKVVARPAKVVVRHPVHRTRLVVHRHYPLRRALPASVVIRPARRAVVIGSPVVFLPSLLWRPAVVAMPARERLVWQDSESIGQDEGWVDTNFGVDESGNALFLDIAGRAGLNFAEVTFANGNVQVVDFNDQTHGTGIYKLLDFADGRHVKTVRMLAKSESAETRLAVYLSK